MNHKKRALPLFISTLLLTIPLFFLSGCGNGEKEQVRSKTREFIMALYDGNSQVLQQVAPGLIKEPERPAAPLFDTVQGYPEWEMGEVSLQGTQATAKVRLMGEKKDLVLHIPLARTGGRWIIEKDIRFSATLDFVPLE